MLDKLISITDGDQERMNIYIRTYKEDVAEYIRILKESMEIENFERIKYATHISKPLFKFFGFSHLYQKAHDIENDIEAQEDTQKIKINTQILISEMEESIRLLSKNT